MKKKKIISILLAFIIAVSVFTNSLILCRASTRPLHILALGDSIAQGYGLEHPKEESYSGILAEMTGSTVQNEGINGLKSGELLEKLEAGEYDSAIEKADIILLSIGSNDILKPCVASIARSFGMEGDSSGELYETMTERFLTQEVEVLDFLEEIRTAKRNLRENEEILAACDEFQENFQRILEEIRRINPYAVLYVDNIYNPYCFTDYSYGVAEILNLCELTEPYVRKLNESFQSEAKDYHLVNTYLLFQQDGYTNVVPASLDEIADINLDPHPNAEGHQAIARLIYEKMDREPPELSVEATGENLLIRANEKIRMVKGKNLRIQTEEESYSYTMSGEEKAVQQEDGTWGIEFSWKEIIGGEPKYGVTYRVNMEEDAVRDMGNNSASLTEPGSFKKGIPVRGILISFFAGVGAVFLGIFLRRRRRRK